MCSLSFTIGELLKAGLLYSDSNHTVVSQIEGVSIINVSLHYFKKCEFFHTMC